MLLRIDVYPENAMTASQTVHVTSNCAREKGELLLVGRKMGDVLLSNDKTVSREHFRLRAVSANQTLQLPSPETNDQILACQQSDIHICVVLENLGRLGTFWVKKTDESKSIMPVDDSATDDDATDDEGGGGGGFKSQMSGQADAALSQVSRALLDPAQTSFQEVGMRESVVLTDLSKPKGRVVLQLGKLGSTIVITREIYRVCFTSTKPKDIAAWNAKFPMIGVEEITVLEKNSTSQLVTTARSTSLKQIAAWSMGIPIVSPEFLKALYDKKSAKDPMPNVQDFPPEADGEDFWLVKPNPRLWRSCTMISIKQDEIEDIVRAAGAKVVELHRIVDDKEALDKAKSIILSRAKNSTFGVADSRRKIAKLLKQAGLLQVTPKQLIRYITEQRMIEDGKGNVIGEQTGQESLEAQEDAVGSPQVSPNAVDKTEQTIIVDTKSVREVTATALSQDKDPQSRTLPTKHSITIEKGAGSGNGNDPFQSITEKSRTNERSAKVGENDSRISQDSKLLHERRSQGSVGGSRSARLLSQTEKVQKTPLTEVKKRQEEESKQKTNYSSPSRLRTTSKSSDLESGWLSAKPKGRARRDFVKNKEEIRALLGVEDLLDVAPTDVCKGLLLRSASQDPCESAVSSTADKEGPNFKAFRKNSVPPTLRFNIKFKSVLPTAPDRREFDEERREVEEQQRRADELFRDVDRTASKRRRRS